jgi:DNA-binding MarR family transcriptional regulator
MYKIKNWEKFNLYNPKNPRYQKKMTWFKFYGTDYINNIDIHKLSFEQKAVLVELWCLGSESDGMLPEIFEIAFRLHYSIDFIEKIVEELFTRGWLEKDYTPVRIEKRREEKKREDIYVVKTTNRFEEFWENYPNVRKVNKKTCLERWANKNLDVELSYNKFGQATLSGVSGNQFKIDGTTYQFNQTATITAKADSYGIALKPKAELAPGFEVFGTLGYHMWDAELNAVGVGGALSASEDGNDIFYGVGLKYTSGNLSAALTYTEYELDTENIKSTGIRAAYRF